VSSKDEVELNPTKVLYQAIIPNLPQYLVVEDFAHRCANEMINIMAYVLLETCRRP
jgi:hypothetical protein